MSAVNTHAVCQSGRARSHLVTPIPGGLLDTAPKGGLTGKMGEMGITWSWSWPDQPAHAKRLQGWMVRVWCVVVVAGRVASGPWMSQPLGPLTMTPGTNQRG